MTLKHHPAGLKFNLTVCGGVYSVARAAARLADTGRPTAAGAGFWRISIKAQLLCLDARSGSDATAVTQAETWFTASPGSAGARHAGGMEVHSEGRKQHSMHASYSGNTPDSLWDAVTSGIWAGVPHGALLCIAFLINVKSDVWMKNFTQRSFTSHSTQSRHVLKNRFRVVYCPFSQKHGHIQKYTFKCWWILLKLLFQNLQKHKHFLQNYIIKNRINLKYSPNNSFGCGTIISCSYVIHKDLKSILVFFPWWSFSFEDEYMNSWSFFLPSWTI